MEAGRQIPSMENGIRVELIPFEIDPTVPATAGKSTLATLFSANVVTVDPRSSAVRRSAERPPHREVCATMPRVGLFKCGRTGGCVERHGTTCSTAAAVRWLDNSWDHSGIFDAGTIERYGPAAP
jgi:hypothetical protein